MTATLPSRPLLGAKRTPWVPSHLTDIRVTWAKARRLQSLQAYRSQQRESADEAAAMRQIEADQAAEGFVPAPCLPFDPDTTPF